MTSDRPADEATTAELPRPPRRRTWLRRALVAMAVSAALVVTVVVVWDGPSVGHFTSAAGHREFTAAYDRAMDDLPEPAATLDLRTDHGVVRVYRFAGADPDAVPIVLLPGRASASPVWADNLPSLLALGAVYTVDLLGEPGASVQSRPIETDEDQAEWLHQALRQLPEPRVHVMGISIGGWTATNLAIHRPDHVASLITIEPVMTFANMSTEAIVRSIPASVRWAPTSWRDSFNSWTAGGAPVEDVPVADMIESGMRHYSLGLPAPSRFADDELRGLTMPVLVVLAGRSVMHDAAAAADEARRTLPDATVMTYDDATHAINGERPDELAADVGTFVEAIG